MLLISTVCIAFAAVPQPINLNNYGPDTLWVEDSTTGATSYSWNTASISPGYTFTVNFAVNMSSSDQVFSWEIEFTWPSFLTLMSPTSAGQVANGPWMSGYADTGTGWSNTTNEGEAFDSLLANATYPAFCSYIPGHAGIFFRATFEINSEPTMISGPFTGAINVTYSNGIDTWWYNDLPSVNTEVPFQYVYNLPITYTWSAPTQKPYMIISGAGTNSTPLVFGPYAPSAVGMTFTATVSVKNVVPAWSMDDANFTMTWNGTVIQVLGPFPGANETIASGWTVLTNTKTVAVNNITTWTFAANYTGGGSGIIPVATLTFTVELQESAPPYPLTYVDYSYITFPYQEFSYPLGLIPSATNVDPLRSGYVTVEALIVLALPYLEVVPDSIIIGPSPSIGTTFTVNVEVYNLTEHWYCVGIQYRLEYNASVLGFVSATEGPFMQNSIWDLYGTFFFSFDNPAGDIVYPVPHVMIFDLIYPNLTTGMYDQPIFPNTVENASVVNPILTTFTFQVLEQNGFDGTNITTSLNLVPFWLPTVSEPYTEFIDMNGNFITNLPGSNGTVTIEPLVEVNRAIDLFGGAVNDGYGNLVDWTPSYPSIDPLGGSYLAFPAPYGGQGPDAPMDLVFPQSQVYLNAYLTYNYWPIEFKDVGFEVEGPFYHVTTADNGGLLYNATGYLVINATVTSQYVPEQGQTYYDAFGNVVLTLPNAYQVWAKFSATTDHYGVASITYRMPWPDNPDLYTGVWKITATATVADQVVSDVMMFYYQRLVYITSVSTDMYNYVHNQEIKVTVTYETHSIQMYPALFAVDALDNLSVPFGFATYCTMVGGTVFCTWLPGEFTVSIWIPKWAYAGFGYIQVSVYDKDPSIGGEAYAPEYTPYPQIDILPYNTPLSVSTDLDSVSPIEWSLSANIGAEVQPITATAVGGFPYLVGYAYSYNYTWTVINSANSSSWTVMTDNLVPTSTYNFNTTYWGLGVWYVKVTAFDSFGGSATDEVGFIIGP